MDFLSLDIDPLSPWRGPLVCLLAWYTEKKKKKKNPVIFSVFLNVQKGWAYSFLVLLVSSFSSAQLLSIAVP